MLVDGRMNFERKCKNVYCSPTLRPTCSTARWRPGHTFWSLSHQSSHFNGRPLGRCVTQTEHVWQTINTHRKQARLVAYTGHTSNNTTPTFFSLPFKAFVYQLWGGFSAALCCFEAGDLVMERQKSAAHLYKTLFGLINTSAEESDEKTNSQLSSRSP